MRQCKSTRAWSTLAAAGRISSFFLEGISSILPSIVSCIQHGKFNIISPTKGLILRFLKIPSLYTGILCFHRYLRNKILRFLWLSFPVIFLSPHNSYRQMIFPDPRRKFLHLITLPGRKRLDKRQSLYPSLRLPLPLYPFLPICPMDPWKYNLDIPGAYYQSWARCRGGVNICSTCILLFPGGLRSSHCFVRDADPI